MQARALAGYAINVNDWFIISEQLKGTVGEDRQLNAANTYHLTITASISSTMRAQESNRDLRLQ